MLADRAAAVRSLGHDVASVRRCAASVLICYWKLQPGGEGSDGLYRLAIGDPDDETRLVALRALISCYKNTDDISVGESLASIVRDERRPPLLRTFAYHGLFVVRGLPIPRLREATLARNENPKLPRVPEDVDWPFVQSFLTEGRQPRPSSWLEQAIPERERALVRCYAEAEEAYHFGKYEEAIAMFSEAIRLRPRLPRTYYMRAKALSGLERYGEAIRDLTIAIKLMPDWALALDERADAYQKSGLIRKAAADREAAKKIGQKRGGD
jgi:tetratricopeptide (TPR) repeat protein